MKRRLVIVLVAGGLVVAMAVPALAAGPTDRAMGTVFFDDEIGVAYRLTFTGRETDPSEARLEILIVSSIGGGWSRSLSSWRRQDH